MGLFRKSLGHMVELQKRFAVPLFLIVIAITSVVSMGLWKLSLQTDFRKEMPQGLPIMQLNDRIRDTFSGQDTQIVILTLDDDSNAKNALRDIRDPSVIQYMIALEDSLEGESEIVGVFSPATYLRGDSVHIG